MPIHQPSKSPAMQQDARFQRFEVIPMTGALGAEIRGLDLAADPDEAVFHDLRMALAHHHVLAVRDQKMDPRILHHVARRIGPFSGNPVHIPIDGLDDIVRFVRDEDETGPVIGENWHMDLAWMEQPPGVTILYGETIPAVGGDTCFASLEHAYAALSPRLQEILSGLAGVHAARGVFAGNAKHRNLGVRAVDEEIEAKETVHPVVCAHPVTGRPYLFISGVMRRFEGLTEAESRPLIDYLLTLAVRPEYTCRMRWQPGTLGMWENACLLHTAINDYAGHRRVMYRTTVEGSRPQRLT
jgi:taurine dioxygenase